MEKKIQNIRTALGEKELEEQVRILSEIVILVLQIRYAMTMSPPGTINGERDMLQRGLKQIFTAHKLEGSLDQMK